MDTSQRDLNTSLKNTLALVLAGGRGSRLMDLTDSLAKPAIHFAGKFRIIDFPLTNCIHSGIRKVAVPTQYRSHHLIQHVQRGWNFLKAELQEFIEIWPAQQQTADESWYRGTADAVYQNMDLLKAIDPTYILVLAGDHVYKQDYSKMLAQHIERRAEATVACVEVPIGLASSFGVVKVDENEQIVEFMEKPANPAPVPGRPDTAFASMGIYIFNADFLFQQLIRDAGTQGSSRDFGKDMLPSLVGRSRLFAHRFADSCVRSGPQVEPYWRDVGTVDAYWEANIDLTSVTPALDLYDPDWPIWTTQEQRPPAKFVFDDDDRRGVALDSVVGAGCIVSGGTVRGSLISNNVRVNSHSLVEDSVILPNCDIGRHAVIRKAIIAEGTHIPQGMEIGVDAELDAKRFYRSEGGVVLVTRQMIEDLD
ncbi:glucose-1-phosphate adenylyltransferase [uncultured Alphaproteobacteria bacterium]|uniref:Glucose-1-phosphate adenylyltransferase n=1 Tax=uncultured Alphaproteobacteria bacterium TaxID=91750 RepID=A0A212JLN8_9PROT|nr:glucose-1-phosphate adenylyltransferase [uncultured Alphaproteobacteria bacterium]